MAATVAGILLSGTHASRPAASAPPVGSVYSCSDHSLIYVTNGSAWSTWATLGTSGGIASTIVDAKGDIIAATAADTVSRLAAGTDGQVLTAASGQATGLQWATPSSGGLTHSYLGYNTIGGTTEAVTVRRWYAKKITVATAGVLTSIGAYVDQTTAGTTTHMGIGLFEDNAGTPRYMLGANAPVIGTGVFWPEHSSGVAGDPRWMSLPLGVYVTAADYWIGVVFDSANFNVYKDTSGADRYWTHATGIRFTDAGIVAITTTTDRYSIRASHIS